MTKTKAQLRAEAVERLKSMRGGMFSYKDAAKAVGVNGYVSADTFRDKLVDLLTDDCGPCYSCAKLAELRAENNALRGKVGDIREDVAERDDVIAVLKADNAVLHAKLDEWAERKCPGYEPERHYCRYHNQDFELNHQTVSRLKRENAELARDLGECMAERDELRRENAKLSDDEFYLRCTLVDMNGEVVG